MTTITLPIVTITEAPDIAGNDRAMEEIRDGLRNAQASADKPEIEPFWYESLGEYDDVINDWESLVEEAAASIAPEVARMLQAAIAERLPWTGEGRGVRGKAPVIGQ